MFLRSAWYAAGFSGDLEPDMLQQAWIAGQPLVLFRRPDGTAVALEDRCCHRGAPLSCGRIEGDSVRCMYHGLRFDPGGRCIEVPGQRQVPDNMRVRAFPLCERDGWLWVWMGEAARADEALVPPAMGLTDERWTLGGGFMDYKANYQLINDNLCDFSHLSFVHIESFGGGNESEFRAYADLRPQVEQLERGIRVSRWTRDQPAPPFLAGFEGMVVDSYLTYDYLAPGVLLMWSGMFPKGTADAVGNGRPTSEPLHANFTSQAVTPIDEKHTRYYFTWGPSTKENRPFLKEGMVELAIKAFKEDRHIIEAQQRIHDACPDLEMKATVHDRGPILMRHVLTRLIEQELKIVETNAIG